jgi:hypothetical protein
MTTGIKPAPLPGWLRVDYHYKVGADGEALNTLWLSYNATEAEAADDTDLSTIEAKIRNDWLTYHSPHISVSVVLQQLRLILFRASGEIALPFTTSAAGALTGVDITAQASVVVNWDVHAFYRGGKPKFFMPPPTESKINTMTTWQAAYASSLENDMNTWLSVMHLYTSTNLTSSPVPIAPSWATGGAYRTTAVQRQIYRAWVQPRVCTQRRRLGAPVG